MSVYVRSGLRGMVGMLPRLVLGKRAQPQSSVARKLTTDRSSTQVKIASHLQRMFQAVKNGLSTESNSIATRVKEESTESPERFKQMKKTVKEIMKKEPEKRTHEEVISIKIAQLYEQKLVRKIHDCHNFNLAYNPDYRTQYEEAVFSCLAKTCAAEEMTERTFVFRGVQFDNLRPASEEAAQVASPDIVFNRFTSGPILSIGRSHHDGEMLMPTINDPYLASEEVYAKGRVGWTGGVLSTTLKSDIAGQYAIAAHGLAGSGGRCDGHVFVVAPLRGVTLADHLHHKLTDLETRGADKSYELVSAVLDPCTVVGARRVYKDGHFGPLILNPNADGSVKQFYEREKGNNPALEALQHASDVTELAQLYKLHEDPAIQKFHERMAVDKEAHAARVIKRLAAQDSNKKE